MTCPECGVGTLRRREAETIEPHGEVTYQEWWECSCGLKYGVEELEDLNSDGPKPLGSAESH